MISLGTAVAAGQLSGRDSGAESLSLCRTPVWKRHRERVWHVPESCRSWPAAHAARYWLQEQQEAVSDKEADAPTTFLNGTVISADLSRLFHSFTFRGQMFSELRPESKHDFQKYGTAYISLS